MNHVLCAALATQECFNEAQSGMIMIMSLLLLCGPQDGAGIVDSKSRGKVASTLAQNSWIDLGDFNGETLFMN